MQNFREILERQRAYFITNATKSFEWRIEQLNRMERLLKENTEAFYEAMQKDFKTASSEYVFEVQAPLGTIEFTKSQLKEWMKPVSAAVPKALAASGHTATVIREPYGPTLVIGALQRPAHAHYPSCHRGLIRWQSLYSETITASMDSIR